MPVQLPRTVSPAQMQEACRVLGIPKGAAVAQVILAFNGEEAGMTLGCLARNHLSTFITDADGEPLMAYGHVPIGPDEEVSPDGTA